jgi:hypothetical protein
MKKQTQVVAAIVLGFLAFAGAIFIYSNKQGNELTSPVTEASPPIVVNNEETQEIMVEEVHPAMTYQFSSLLEDVTGGKSTGIAKSNFEDGAYTLLATFENLPDPTGTDFYEGWIVRKGADFDVISTGQAVLIDGQYRNQYGLDQDLTDHDFYVLTIEPDDGDPAPADHVLEGTMVKTANL